MRTRREGLALCLLGAVVWISLISLPYVPSRVTLDDSGMWSLAYIWQHQFRAGIDWAFTYGPLGFLASPLYHEASLGPKLLWEIVFKSMVVVLALRRHTQLASGQVRALHAIALVCFLADYDYPDAGYLIGLFVLVTFLVQTGAPPLWLALGSPILGALALIKFSLLPLGLLSVLAIALAARESRGPRYALGTLAYFAVIFCLAWRVGDPSLTDLPDYLRSAMWLAAGYDGAMGLEARSIAVVVGIVLLLVDAALIAASALNSGGGARRILVAALAAAWLGVAWKHGFVGSGGFHFFVFAGLLPFYLDPPRRPRVLARWPATLLLGVVALAATGLWASSDPDPTSPGVVEDRVRRLSQNLSTLRRAPHWRASYERDLDALRARYDLPLTRERVGSETIDVFSYDQGIVLLNRLDWKPRPSFQGHNTYTPELLHLNARFFESEEAPRFVLFRLQSVNGRLPTLDESAALRVVLQRYEPVMTERSYLLLERRVPAAAAPRRWTEPEVLLERASRLEAPIDVSAWSGEILLARLEVRYTLLGRLRRIFLRAAPVIVEFDVGGKPQRRRVEPPMASEAFLLSPWLGNESEFVAWRSGFWVRDVTSFRVVAGDGGWFVHDEVGVTILRDPSLAPAWTREEVFLPMLDPQPDSVATSGGYFLGMAGGRIGMMLPVPSEIRYRLAPGSYLIEGFFGVVFYDMNGHTNFVCSLVDAKLAESRLFERRLDPSRPTHHGAQRLALPFEVGDESELILRVEADAGRPPHTSRPYWTEVRIRRRGRRRVVQCAGRGRRTGARPGLGRRGASACARVGECRTVCSADGAWG